MDAALVVIWAASRAPAAVEKRVISEVAEAGAQIRNVPMPLLAREILPSLARGAVVVVVGSRRDAATALSLGADETVRIAKSVTLRKSTMESAIERARNRAQARMPAGATPTAVEECPGLVLLMSVLQRRLGSPLSQATLKCGELADELVRVVGIVDRLMQRARLGTPREHVPAWLDDAKDYARATLKAEALTSELRETVERSDALVRMLSDLSLDTDVPETDAASLVEHLAEFLRGDVAETATLEVVTAGPCIVGVARATLICIVCAAIEHAIENVRAGQSAGHLVLRVSRGEGEALIEIVDDGAPGVTDLRASILDPFLSDPRKTRLRQLRERARRVGGDLIVDEDEQGTIVSLYLPSRAEPAQQDSAVERPPVAPERRRH